MPRKSQVAALLCTRRGEIDVSADASAIWRDEGATTAAAAAAAATATATGSRKRTMQRGGESANRRLPNFGREILTLFFVVVVVHSCLKKLMLQIFFFSFCESRVHHFTCERMHLSFYCKSRSLMWRSKTKVSWKQNTNVVPDGSKKFFISSNTFVSFIFLVFFFFL